VELHEVPKLFAGESFLIICLSSRFGTVIVLDDHPTVVAMPKEKGDLELKRSKVTRLLYAIGGTVSLGLAMLGIVVPGLPVTPFALLSAFLYAKSSKRMYDWLLNNRVLGPRIKNYQRRKGLTRKGKAGVIAVMSLMVLFSSFVVIRDNLTVRVIILSLGVIGSLVVWFVVPTAREE
jgi:uncharacterized membrane protein YbaN (DUF454 family)